jgi:signal transduction histidine kinase/HPt (histidine-containing phosphotransfer) domain-containing protein
MTVDVLLVEDDEGDAGLIVGLFRRTKKAALFRVSRAATLKDADALLVGLRSSGAAVLLDLALADSADEATLAWIRTTAVTFPVIVLTGNDDQALPQRALRAGAQDYLTKWDFNSDALTRAILYATERHQIQQELRKAKDAADVASRAKTEFLANMSHEIRTPLAAVLGAAELLAESPLAPDQRRYLDLLNKAGTHLRALIDEILDLSKIEAGGVVLERTNFDLGEVLDDVCGLLRPRAESKGLELAGELLPGPARVTGDPHRLTQVLVNLVGNAIKFTARGQVRLLAEKQTGGHAFRFTVADTGVGVSTADEELIFEAFAQADASTTRLHGGTGLGLAIARQLVELMGGQLTLKSAPGAGSEFSFSLILPPAQTQATTPVGTDELERLLPPERGRDGRRWRVLVADDAAENRTLLAGFLRTTPFDVEFATSGQEALDAYTRSPPDAILLDLHMPGMDGFAAATRIREIEAAEGRGPVPLIAYTADAFDETRARCLAAGFTDHLVKPVRRATLRKTIARALRSGLANVTSAAALEIDLGSLDDDIRDLLPGYLENRVGDVAAMRGALRQGDHRSLADIAHRIKGSGGSYGLARVSELAGQIEAAVKNARTDEIGDHLRELEDCLAAARSQLGGRDAAPRGDATGERVVRTSETTPRSRKI